MAALEAAFSCPLRAGFFVSGDFMSDNSTPGAVKRPRWIDTTINLQTLVGSVIGGAVALTIAYYGVIGRVSALEQKDREHDRQFSRVETDLRQQKDETTQQVRAISADVKEQLNGVSNDVKEIRRYLMDNAAGARPDIRRWSK